MNWTLADALSVIRILQPETRKFNFHLCLGGSVLNTGSSEKDLDLYFLPLDNGRPPDGSELVKWLEGLWGTSEDLLGRYAEAAEADPPYPLLPSQVYQQKLKFTRPDGRIDVFVLGVPGPVPRCQRPPAAPVTDGGDYGRANRQWSGRTFEIPIRTTGPLRSEDNGPRE